MHEFRFTHEFIRSCFRYSLYFIIVLHAVEFHHTIHAYHRPERVSLHLLLDELPVVVPQVRVLEQLHHWEHVELVAGHLREVGDEGDVFLHVLGEFHSFGVLLRDGALELCEVQLIEGLRVE